MKLQIRKSSRIIVFLIFLISASTIFNMGNDFEKKVVFKPNAQTSYISIIGNDQLSTFISKTGEGTELDPYVIQDFNLRTNNFAIPSFLLHDTNLYLVIRNCTFRYDTTEKIGVGLDILNVTNLIIENCTFRTSNRGLNIANSNHIIIRNNTAFENT